MVNINENSLIIIDKKKKCLQRAKMEREVCVALKKTKHSSTLAMERPRPKAS